MTMGGGVGLRGPELNVGDPDLWARAVIASARSYGDDPVEAMTSAVRTARRCLPAAASAMALVLNIHVYRAAPPLGLAASTVRSAKTLKRGGFAMAEAAALRALSFAAWRPEARASVVAAPCVPHTPRALHIDPNPRLRPLPSAAEDAEIARAAAERGARASAKPSWVELTDGRSLGDRIMDVLADGSATSIGLATILDAKETMITSCLAVLHQAGRIAPGEMPENGRRYQRWGAV